MRLHFALVLLSACAAHTRAPETPLALPSHPPPAPSVVSTPAPKAPGEHTPSEWATLGDEAFARTNLVDATRFYLQALRGDSDVAPYAWYKLGFIRWNESDGAAALEAFLHAIRAADAHHDAKIARVARIDIVSVYAQYGSPSKAYDFFRTFSQTPLDTLGALGRQYLDEGKWNAARAVYADLAARDATNACAHHVRENAAADASRGSPMPADSEIDARIARCP